MSDSTAAPTGPVVEVANMAFTPSSITVNVGETVTWKFEDRGTPHDVVGVGDARAVLHSPPLQTGTFAFAFAEPGTYQYTCSFHPDMHGTIVVR
ncbi:cupredoxin domain-containing protein [Rhodococcus spelaei]|uniref:cupredoxin domain-containing protein n=1 Tax=Rhodococcus spelaei TaxID=2546320 RepID=UPI001FEB9CEB|nr:cupredoxin domain-containing protein [Rhodococcus spelaei]